LEHWEVDKDQELSSPKYSTIQYFRSLENKVTVHIEIKGI